MAKRKVAVIFGGASNEHDISLISAYNIIKSIPEDKYEVITIGITKTGRWLHYPGDVKNIQTGAWETDPDCIPAVISPDPIHKGIIILEEDGMSIHKIDAIFPVLHGKNGEDGTIQGLFTMARIPFVGCGVLSSAACMDKEYTHTLLDYNGVRTAKWRKIDRSELCRLEKQCEIILKDLSFPLFVKPANCGSSIGISKASNLEELDVAVKKAFSHDCKVIVEEFVKGREIEVAVFGYDNVFASYAGEIQACNEFYDYDAKYVLDGSTLSIPAELEPMKMNEIRETAVKAYKIMGCKGLARVDFFVTEDGGVILNEINTLPGFTSISMYPKLMEDFGMCQPYLVDKLIEQAIENFI